MSKTVYTKHDSAFSQVSAGALVLNGEQVGTLAFKHSKDGAGRLSCYLHLHAHAMVVGTASGYGYDKMGAAFESACRMLDDDCLKEYPQFTGFDCEGYDFQTAIKMKANGIKYFKAV